MSQDIFKDFPSSQRTKVHDGFVGGSMSRASAESISELVPKDAETQNLVGTINRQRFVEIDTPKHCKNDVEAEMAERQRKKMDFHFFRAIPRFVEEGWKHLQEEMVDEEIRVYTIDSERRRFWGIKPAGIGMSDFWEQNDPDVGRYYDTIAVTWADPLIRPSYNPMGGVMPVVWAGRGTNPDSIPSNPPAAKAPPPIKAKKSKRGQKSPDVNPTHRVRKTPKLSTNPKKKTPQKSLADKLDAGHSRSKDQIPDGQEVDPASERTSRSKRTLIPPDAPPAPATSNKDPTPSKRPRRHPASEANPVPKSDTPPVPKRPRGRPAKPKPATSNKDASLPKRPRGRPPGKAKGAAVKGHAGVTKPPPAPSNHKMSTRGKGAAKFMQLP